MKETNINANPPSTLAAGSDQWKYYVVNLARGEWVSRHRSWKGANTRMTRLVRHGGRNLYRIEPVHPNYLIKRKEFGLCRYWPRNAELLALILTMAQD